MKTVYLIHGWEGNPDNNWFPWLKTELEKLGHKVVVPAMPNSSNPKKAEWVAHLQDIVHADQDSFFVGHSLGCRAILRYLESLPEVAKIGGCVLVAGWVTLLSWDDRGEKAGKIIEDWINPALDYGKILKHASKFAGIFSDDDELVPKDNYHVYEKELHAKVVVLHGKGHFSDDDHALQLPEALDQLKELMR